MARRLFTVEEANAALAEVRPIAERMVERRRALAAALTEQEELKQSVAGNGGDLAPGDFEHAQRRVDDEAAAVAQCIERIHSAGALVKDLDSGLVDFPARRGGEVVLLCWRVGEEEIAFWHREEEGFAGRKPLPL